MSTSNAAHNAAPGYDFDDEFELEFGEAPVPVAGMQPVAPVAPVQPVLLEGDINPREPLPMTAVAPAAASFNPVGDLMAGAQSALAPVIGEVSVPRIAIHVFAERQDTLAAAERAGQDLSLIHI